MYVYLCMIFKKFRETNLTYKNIFKVAERGFAASSS